MWFRTEWSELFYISGPQRASETNIPGLTAAAPTQRPDLPWSGTIRLCSFCTHAQTRTQKVTHHKVDLAQPWYARKEASDLEEGRVGELSPQRLRARLILTVALVHLEALFLRRQERGERNYKDMAQKSHIAPPLKKKKKQIISPVSGNRLQLFQGIPDILPGPGGKSWMPG